MSITELSIKRPSFIIVIFMALTVVGLFSYKQMQYELLPKFSPPVLTVTTIYPGASPLEVETNVTKPIEDALATLEGISTIRSTSQENSSFVVLELKQSIKPDVALQDAQRRVGQITGALPTGVRTPNISKIALDEFPILRMSVEGKMEPKKFTQFLKDNIVQRLSNITGVGQILLLGGEEREIKVNMDMEKVRGYNLSIANIANVIKASNIEFPTGNIKDTDSQFTIRLAGKVATVEDLKEIIVGISRTGGDVKLKDVAEIQDGIKDLKQVNRLNGIQAIGMQVLKQSDANAVDMSKLVRKELAKIEKDYAGLQLKFVVAQDSSIYTMEAADAVTHDLMIAVFLVGMVMLVFLHSFRNALIVMVAIPCSLVGTFIAMYLFGFSLNLMTLLGLSLVIGILVDDSIVVLENIYRHLEMGKKPRIAALEGRDEIGFTAIAITLVDVVVFFPLSLLQGIVGNIMKQFAIVVLVATLMSLFVSFTVTPMLASRFSKFEPLTKNSLMGAFGYYFEQFFSWLVRQYAGALSWCLRYSWITAFVSIAMLVGSFMLVAKGFIGGEFISKADKGEFSVVIELPSGSSIEQTNKMAKQVENIISDFPEVASVYSNVGVSAEGFVSQSSNNISEIIVTLLPPSQRTKPTAQMIKDVKDRLAQIPSIKPRVSPIGIFGGADQTPIQMVVSGTNLDSVRKAARIMENIARATAGTTDIRLSAEDGKPETRVEINREKLASFGLNIAEVGQTLQVALRGDDNSKFRDIDNTEYDIRIQLDVLDRNKTEDLMKIPFVNRLGQQVELQQFATIKQSLGATKLQRENRNASITIFVQVQGRPAGDVAVEMDVALAKTTLPIGTKMTHGGDIKNQREADGSMGLAMLAALIFIYMVMVALYDSFVYPFVVLFSIPMALIGAFLALALTMKTLNIFSGLGLIMMMGLVAKNAILIVDFANGEKEKGHNTFDALIEAGKERLRPILMTTIAMVFGMLPIALAKSAGAEWKTGLAWALIGGLTSSMFLTLVFVPVVYQATDKTMAFFKRIFKIKDTKHEDEEEDTELHHNNQVSLEKV